MMHFRKREPVKVIQYTLETEKEVLKLLNGEWANNGTIEMGIDGERYIEYTDSCCIRGIGLGEYLVYDDEIIKHYSEEDLNFYYVKIEEVE